MKATRKARGTRDRILDVAIDLFYREGIRAIGVDTIVEQSGVAKMTLYNQFGSKDGLIVAVLERRSREWLASFREALETRATDPRMRLDAVFDVLHELFQNPNFRGCTFANAKAELAEPDHPAHATLTEHYRAVQAYFLELAQAAGYVSPRAERISEQLLMLVNGATVERCLTGPSNVALRAKEAAATLMR